MQTQKLRSADKLAEIRMALEHIGSNPTSFENIAFRHTGDEFTIRRAVRRPSMEKLLEDLRNNLHRLWDPSSETVDEQAEECIGDILSMQRRWKLWATGLTVLGYQSLADGITADLAAMDEVWPMVQPVDLASLSPEELEALEE